MSFRRSGIAVLGGIVLLLLLSSGIGSRVQADQLLQDVPRLDGVNIYFTESGGEASRFDRSGAGLSRFAGLMRELGANLFTLEWRTTFPTDADLIVIAGPTTDFTPDQTARLWSYVNNGGKLLLLANTTPEARGRVLPVNGGLFGLMWTDMGIRALEDVVVIEGEPEPLFVEVTPTAPSEESEGETAEEEATDEASEAGESPATAPTPILEQVGERPVLVWQFVAENLTDHPIAAGLQGGIYFQGVRSLEVDASIQGFDVTPLVFSEDDFYGETDFAGYLTNGTYAFNIGTDTTRGALPLAAAYSNDETGTRMVVIGDREVATNGGGFRSSPPNSPSFVYPDNVRFIINAVTWMLAAEPVAFEFPTPGPTATVTITPSPSATPAPTATATPAS
jgi:hypothetical protein